MTPRLPQEIIDRIAFYLPYEQAVGISKYMKEKLTDRDEVNRYAVKGNLFAIKWLYYHEQWKQKKWSCVIDFAAGHGHLDVVKWLHRHHSEGCTTDAMDWAASAGHLEIVKWLHENRTEGCTEQAMNWAAWSGHFKVVKWLYDNRSEVCASQAVYLARRYRHVEIVKWLEAKVTTHAIENQGLPKI